MNWSSVPLPFNFYPRSPCGERLCAALVGLTASQFLSTLSLRRATVSWLSNEKKNDPFLSTLSLRRATAPLADRAQADADFYPRSPCGERPPVYTSTAGAVKFLSTLSLRRATSRLDQYEGSTAHFYPRSPCGERQWGPGC